MTSAAGFSSAARLAVWGRVSCLNRVASARGGGSRNSENQRWSAVPQLSCDSRNSDRAGFRGSALRDYMEVIVLAARP